MTVTGVAGLYMTATNELNKTTFSNSDHVTFSGSTELDNGMTVTYSLQLDGDEADDGVIDNHSVVLQQMVLVLSFMLVTVVTLLCQEWMIKHLMLTKKHGMV